MSISVLIFRCHIILCSDVLFDTYLDYITAQNDGTCLETEAQQWQEARDTRKPRQLDPQPTREETETKHLKAEAIKAELTTRQQPNTDVSK